MGMTRRQDRWLRTTTLPSPPTRKRRLGCDKRSQCVAFWGRKWGAGSKPNPRGLFPAGTQAFRQVVRLGLQTGRRLAQGRSQRPGEVGFLVANAGQAACASPIPWCQRQLADGGYVGVHGQTDAELVSGSKETGDESSFKHSDKTRLIARPSEETEAKAGGGKGPEAC